MRITGMVEIIIIIKTLYCPKPGSSLKATVLRVRTVPYVEPYTFG